MAADHDKFVIDMPVGDRNSGHGGHRYGTCHTGHDGDRYAGLGAGENFLISAGEYERIPALEADHEAPLFGPFYKNVVDRFLSHRPPIRDLGGVDDLDVRPELGE